MKADALGAGAVGAGTVASDTVETDTVETAAVASGAVASAVMPTSNSRLDSAAPTVVVDPSALPPMPAGTSRITRIPPPREGKWFWYVLWGIAWFLRLFMARVVAEGRENIPKSGGFVVTCNHTRGFDFVPLGYCLPRQAYFMVKAEAFEVNPALSWILHNGGGIPVKRGKADMHAIEQTIALVSEGYPAALFPEGTRSPDGTLQAAYTGAVRIALHTNTQIVPAVVVGAEEMFRRIGKPWVRPVVTVRYGAPMTVSGDPADKAQVGAETRRVMLTMSAMLPAEMRGMWADGRGRVVGAGETRAQRTRHAASTKVDGVQDSAVEVNNNARTASGIE